MNLIFIFIILITDLYLKKYNDEKNKIWIKLPEIAYGAANFTIVILYINLFYCF